MGIITRIRTLYLWGKLRICGADIGKNIRFEGPLDILLRDGASLKNLKIGDNVVFGGKTYIRMRKNGKITLGKNARIGTEVWLVTANNAELVAGENAILGHYSIFNGGHGISIGKYCIFGAFVYVNSSEHCFRRDELIQNQRYFGEPVLIGDDVWLGGHVIITQGVMIGKGSVIGGGAIVTNNIPEYKIAVGTPARVIRDRE
jgi:acetyltransferase-like isoleucine patch superfamily enzyme